MKLFAIITAGLMTAGTGAYFLHQGECPLSKSCPVAKSGGCCESTPSCCEVPCASCATSCSDCCVVCEECCSAGVLTSVSAKADCCSTGDVCCVAGAACCLGATSAKAEEEDCPFCVSPTNVVTKAAVAGASRK